jgi:coproporphyrinogen III oxidase
MSQRIITKEWFENLRNDICARFEEIESEYAAKHNLTPGKFQRTAWERAEGGGGVMAVMRGNVFEKVGVNVSAVEGEFIPEMRKQIPGAEENPEFFATGVSLVSHMKSPLVPAAHFNTRYIETTKSWFGGGGDLTPMYPDDKETSIFHKHFKMACDKHNPEYYPKFKKECDEYFYLPHRKEHRGVGGIFYDYLNTGSFEEDFAFTKDVGLAFADAFPAVIRPKMFLEWTQEQREYQLHKRGRYVEFNLLYDRGTKFGLMTGGNTEAILMSMPPEVKW